MTPQALTRVDGTVLGVRQIDLPATAARLDDSGQVRTPARVASTLWEVDVATVFARYNDELTSGVTAVLPVTYDAHEVRPTVGEVVSLLVYPYPSVTKTRSGWLRRAAHRFVAVLPADAAGGAKPAAASRVA